MKILITGGTTFVSRYAAEFFVANGNDVTVINRGSRPQVDGVTHINCDRTALGERLNGKHFDLILDITAYTEEHIKTLLDSGITFDDYIFISSSAVYPETNPQPFTEEQSCGYNSVWGEYGMNKLKAEQYLQANVPNAYILRPPYFYGIYENLYREAFPFDCAMQDRPFYIPQNGDMKLQFFNVSDLCRFVEILIDKHPENHIFNVGNKDIVTVKEWIELCYKAVGKTAEFVSVDKEIPQRDYFCFYDYEYILDVSKQNDLMTDTIPLEKGLKEEFEWYKNNLDSVYNRKPYMEYIDNNLGEEMTIREIKENELGELLELYTHLHELGVPENNEHLQNTWSEICNDVNHHIIVCEFDGKIISSCVCVIIPNLTRNVRPYAFIENVVTHADYRGKGYATACLNYAKELAVKADCYKMMLLTGSKKEGTLNFYKRAGYNCTDKTAFIQWI